MDFVERFFQRRRCISITCASVALNMNYAGLSRRVRGQRHIQARDPHNAICLVAPQAETPDDLWSKIEQRIDHARQPEAHRNAHLALSAFGGMAFAALVLNITHLGAPASDRLLQAELSHDGQAYHLTAAPAEDRQTIVALATKGLSKPPEKSLEVWFVPQDGSPPGSLGLVSDEGAISAHVIPQIDWANGVIGVSIESRGGSQSGLPEGPIVATSPLELFF